MSLIKTVRNRTRTQYASRKIADRFAPSQPTHAATVAGRNLVTIDGRTVPAAGVDVADVGLPVAVVNAGSAGIAAYSANGAGVAVQFAGGGSAGSGSGMEVHDLNSVWHTGTLADSQAPQFLKLDGTRQLTGNLSVAASVTIDGVDISAHAADPDAHHARATAGSGIAIVGQQVAISPGAAGDGLTWGAGAFNVGAGNGLTVSADAIALTTPGTLTTATSNNAAGSHTHAVTTTTTGTPSTILALDGSGYTTAVKLTAQTIDTASGDLALNPAGVVDLYKNIQADNYASQLTGWRVTYDGQADFRYLYVDEMHAKSFVADLEQALAGGQIISKSVAMLGAAFTAPAASGTATLTVRDLPSAENMAVFQAGDIVRLRTFTRSGGSLTIADCWGVVTSYADQADKLQTWTFTRSAAPNAGSMTAGTVIPIDAIVLDYGTTGNGLHEVNAIDGAYGANSPYSQIVTWTTHPATGQTVRTRTGNLYGLFSVANEFGLYAGDGTGNTNQYLRISNNAVRLNNIPLTLYNGATQTVNIDSAGINIWVGPSSADKRLSWDGSTLTVNGAINVTGGNAATQTYASSAASTAQTNAQSYTDSTAANKGLTNITGTLDNIPNGATYARVNTTLISGGNIRVGSGTKDSTLDGFHIDSGEIVGQLAGADQVVMGTDGKIKAGAGNVWMDAAGLGFSASTGKFTAATASWWHGGQRYLAIGTQSDLGTPTGAFIETYSSTPLAVTANGGITLASTSGSLLFNTYNIWHSGNLAFTMPGGVLTYAGSTMWHAGNSTPVETNGKAGGQSIKGGTASGDDLYIDSTNHATKGDILLAPNGGNVSIGNGIYAANATLEIVKNGYTTVGPTMRLNNNSVGGVGDAARIEFSNAGSVRSLIQFEVKSGGTAKTVFYDSLNNATPFVINNTYATETNGSAYVSGTVIAATNLLIGTTSDHPSGYAPGLYVAGSGSRANIHAAGAITTDNMFQAISAYSEASYPTCIVGAARLFVRVGPSGGGRYEFCIAWKSNDGFTDRVDVIARNYTS